MLLKATTNNSMSMTAPYIICGIKHLYPIQDALHVNNPQKSLKLNHQPKLKQKLQPKKAHIRILIEGGLAPCAHTQTLTQLM